MDTIKSLITSSANPENVSLFVKSLGTLLVLWGLDATVVSQAGNQIVSIVTAIGMLISAGTGLWGLLRKYQLGRWNAVPYSKD